MGERPIPVGSYEVLTDYESPAASVRVFRIGADAESIEGHVHMRSMQIYVALEGSVTVDVDGLVTTLNPYESLPVWQGRRHAAWAAGGSAIVMNISVPPLAADDQVPTSPDAEPSDMRLPSGEDDMND